jgi:hypothetical protein
VILLAQAQAHYAIERVEFTLDGQLLGAAKEPPYQLQWSTLDLEEGDYQLEACAYDVLDHKDCSGITLPLVRPGPSAAMFAALGFLLLALILVVVMVVRTRQRQARGRAAIPAAAVTPAGAAVPHPTARQVLTAVIQPGEGGAAFEASLGPTETIIGRSADSTIMIADELASRRHAVVRYSAELGGYVFEDLSPTNPSIVNGQEYGGPHLLHPGDSVVIGTTILTFR